MPSLVFVIFAAFAGGDTLERRAEDTLAAVEMNVGDTLRFTLASGAVRTLVVEETDARVLLTNLVEPKKPMGGGGTVYVMTCRLRVDGHPLSLRRYVPDQQSFAEPIVVNGLRLWFDGTRQVDRFLLAVHSPGDEKIGGGIPRKDLRLALQDATLPFCPQELRPWYPNPANVLDVARCYNGDDPWMGPFNGAELHGGVDINMPAGTTLWAPIDVDDQFNFHSLATGENNNRWRGIRTWPNGRRWVLQAHHNIRLLVPEKTPLRRGTPFAEAAGVHVGAHSHAHFTFKVGPENDEVMLDPWLLFWEIFENNKRRGGAIHASMAPLGPAATGAPLAFRPVGSRAGTTGNALSYAWSFGDGAGSFEAEPVHAYARPGLYAVTLTVDDGTGRASAIQHLTVDGTPVEGPAPSLESPDFAATSPGLFRIYGEPVRELPNTLEFRARPKSAPRPVPKTVTVRGIPGEIKIDVAYLEASGWLSVTPSPSGLEVAVNAAKLLERHGLYRARVTVSGSGDPRPAQTFAVVLEVPEFGPRTSVVLDDLDAGCRATPGFWLRPRFPDHSPAKWPRGHGGTYFVNGGRSDEDAVVRFTPDLAAGRYEVSLLETTPFRPNEQVPADIRFAVRVRHRGGTSLVWMEPLKDLRIGAFDFAEGTDGWVEILARDSRGQVVADAVRFERK
ncbi:MAG TPA: PKD domain-containing protein [Planctomycetota bacterium]|nr:PKD domain-containing protein [Planctomycetota bacterium]